MKIFVSDFDDFATTARRPACRRCGFSAGVVSPSPSTRASL